MGVSIRKRSLLARIFIHQAGAARAALALVITAITGLLYWTITIIGSWELNPVTNPRLSLFLFISWIIVEAVLAIMNTKEVPDVLGYLSTIIVTGWLYSVILGLYNISSLSVSQIVNDPVSLNPISHEKISSGLILLWMLMVSAMWFSDNRSPTYHVKQTD